MFLKDVLKIGRKFTGEHPEHILFFPEHIFLRAHLEGYFWTNHFTVVNKWSDYWNFFYEVWLEWSIWVKVFKNVPSKICGRQPLKNLKWYGLQADQISSNLLKAVFHKFYLVDSWIPWPIWYNVYCPLQNCRLRSFW